MVKIANRTSRSTLSLNNAFLISCIPPYVTRLPSNIVWAHSMLCSLPAESIGRYYFTVHDKLSIADCCLPPLLFLVMDDFCLGSELRTVPMN